METMYDNSKKSYLDNKTGTKLDYYYEPTGGTAREKMRGFLKEPNEYSSQYGKWGSLNAEQREMIRRLLDEMDRADEVIKRQYEEKQQLISFLEDKIKESVNKILEIKKTKNHDNDWEIPVLKIRRTILQEVLDFVNKGGKDERRRNSKICSCN